MSLLRLRLASALRGCCAVGRRLCVLFLTCTFDAYILQCALLCHLGQSEELQIAGRLQECVPSHRTHWTIMQNRSRSANATCIFLRCQQAAHSISSRRLLCTLACSAQVHAQRLASPPNLFGWRNLSKCAVVDFWEAECMIIAKRSFPHCSLSGRFAEMCYACCAKGFTLCDGNGVRSRTHCDLQLVKSLRLAAAATANCCSLCSIHRCIDMLGSTVHSHSTSPRVPGGR